MNHSFYIDRLLRWLRASNVQVNMHASDLPVSGRCWSVQEDGFELIAINVAGARDALMTLAHEAGHWLGNSTFGYKCHSYQRERQAMVYGWRILRLIGADALISREEWLRFNCR